MNVTTNFSDQWEILLSIARQNGDTQRLNGRFYDPISCAMRLMVTVGGRVGWAHPQTQEGDQAARIHGYQGLREAHKGYRKGYHVVGDAILSRIGRGDPTYPRTRYVLCRYMPRTLLYHALKSSPVP
jgi:hypothetical protein